MFKNYTDAELRKAHGEQLTFIDNVALMCECARRFIASIPTGAITVNCPECDQIFDVDCLDYL